MNEKNIGWLTFGFTFIVSMFGIPIWVFTTFATQNYVKESNAQIYKTIDMAKVDALSHSDMNRISVEKEMKDQLTMLGEIRDTVRIIENRQWNNNNYDNAPTSAASRGPASRR